MKCECCGDEHKGEYGSGRFCRAQCARRFSTLSKRKEINIKISLTLKGKSQPSPLKGVSFEDASGKTKAEEHKQKISTKVSKYHLDKRLKYLARWRDGLETGLKSDNRNRLHHYVAGAIKVKYDNKCSKCGVSLINPFTKLSTLQIHHIDGDRTNSRELNLELLCPNCHSLTFSFGRTRNLRF
jgi:hypothetical protein